MTEEDFAFLIWVSAGYPGDGWKISPSSWMFLLYGPQWELDGGGKKAA